MLCKATFLTIRKWYLILFKHKHTPNKYPVEGSECVVNGTIL